MVRRPAFVPLLLLSIAFVWWAALGLTAGLIAYAGPLFLRSVGAAMAAFALRGTSAARARVFCVGLIMVGLFDLVGLPFNASGLAVLGIAAELVEAVASVWFIVFAIRHWNAGIMQDRRPLRWPLSLIGVNALYWSAQLTGPDAPYVPGNVVVLAAVVLYWFPARASSQPRSSPQVRAP